MHGGHPMNDLSEKSYIKDVKPRLALYSGKVYSPFGPNNEPSDTELARELATVWHGHGTAFEAIANLVNREAVKITADVIGHFYLRFILKLSEKRAFEFPIYASNAHRLGILRQGLLLNSANEAELRRRWCKKEFEVASRFVPNYRAFWERYYDVFGGRRGDEIDLCARRGFSAVRTWLRVFTYAAQAPASGNILLALEREPLVIK